MVSVTTVRTGGLKQRLQQLAQAFSGKPTLNVGFLEAAKYPDGTPVAMVAAIQNFGAPAVGVPPRPFFTAMINQHRDEWAPGVAGILAHNGGDVTAALAALGQVMVNQLRQSIVDTNDPPLSPTTLMLRKMKQKNPTLQFRMSYKVVAEARARVAAGESYAGVSAKPLVQPGIAGGLMLRSVSYEVTRT